MEAQCSFPFFVPLMPIGFRVSAVYIYIYRERVFNRFLSLLDSVLVLVYFSLRTKQKSVFIGARTGRGHAITKPSGNMRETRILEKRPNANKKKKKNKRDKGQVD